LLGDRPSALTQPTISREGRITRYAFRLIAIVCSTLAALQSSPAFADKRVALVIGNAGYRAVAELANPRKDARDVAAALRAAAFAKVVEQYDLTVREMQRALAQFEDTATGADWAVVYYAGHGIEVDGRNYLVPIDAELKRASDVEDETLPLDRVLARVAAAGKLQLVILDACRENSFKRRMAGVATRTIGERGLARIEPAHPNVVVAYAARDSQVALDGPPGENSPYARALLKYLAEPGLELGKFFRKVRDDVLADTGGRQRPFEYGSLTGQDLFFKPALGGPVPLASPSAAPSSPTTAQPGEAERAWAAVKDSTSVAALEAFKAHYGNSFHADLAQVRINELRKLEAESKVAIAPPVPPRPATPQKTPAFGTWGVAFSAGIWRIVMMPEGLYLWSDNGERAVAWTNGSICFRVGPEEYHPGRHSRLSCKFPEHPWKRALGAPFPVSDDQHEFRSPHLNKGSLKIANGEIRMISLAFGPNDTQEVHISSRSRSMSYKRPKYRESTTD
jgi:uncharacterized caspase-like protein